MYASEDWEALSLMDSNLCFKFTKSRRRWIHQLWESRTEGEYFKLCKILREFPEKFREYCRMNVPNFDDVLAALKDSLQGYSNFRKCIEAEEKLMVALRYVFVITVRIKINYTCKMFSLYILKCYII
jgi:hypothetical protein